MPTPVPAAPPTGPHLLDASMFWGVAGGVRRVLSTKQALLLRQGWRHSVLAPGVSGDCHIDCGGLPLPGTGGYRVVLRRHHAQRLIEQAQPDIIESADPYTLAWSVLGAAERLRVPTVAFCHSNLPALAGRLVGGADSVATRRGRWAARRARSYLVGLYQGFNLVLAPSRGLAERLRAWGLRHVAHQPLGVDSNVFHPAAGDFGWRHALCQRLGLATDTRLLVYSGRYAPEKNLGLLSEAVRLLGPGHALIAVGAGPTPPRGPRVFSLPPESDSGRLARLIASCDVYVHAGDQETFGLSVLEAMACGTPVVVSAGGALGELAHDAGLVVERPRAAEWAEAIAASLGDVRWPLTTMALDKARQHDWTHIVAQLSERYLGLMRPQAQPQPRPWGAAAPAAASGWHA